MPDPFKHMNKSRYEPRSPRRLCLSIGEGSLVGYVVEGLSGDSRKPFAVVSETGERHAISGSLPNNLKNILIEVEDRRFYAHAGVDLRAVLRATWKNLSSGKTRQGGSTLSQQLARNLLRDNRRTLGRKLREAALALELEKRHSKEALLDLYLNEVYFGKNLRGVRSASLSIFAKEPEALSHSEQLYLITLLRGPNLYLSQENKAESRYRLLNDLLLTRSVVSKARHSKNERRLPKIRPSQLSVLRPAAVAALAEKIDHKRRLVATHVHLELQANLHEFVSKSEQPLSIVAVRNGKIVASASSYGIDHPLTTRTNVGSTLKPFLFTFFRETGVGDNMRFPADVNSLGWKVNEARTYHGSLTLSEALFHSNNNAFVNAATHVGMDKTLDFLANLLGHPREGIFPAALLGATTRGISLGELALLYDTYFDDRQLTDAKRDCLGILSHIFCNRVEAGTKGVFLKTGTTNKSREKYAIKMYRKHRDTTLAFLLNPHNDETGCKEQGILATVRRFFVSNKQNLNSSWL